MGPTGREKQIRLVAVGRHFWHNIHLSHGGVCRREDQLGVGLVHSLDNHARLDNRLGANCLWLACRASGYHRGGEDFYTKVGWPKIFHYCSLMRDKFVAWLVTRFFFAARKATPLKRRSRLGRKPRCWASWRQYHSSRWLCVTLAICSCCFSIKTRWCCTWRKHSASNWRRVGCWLPCRGLEGCCLASSSAGLPMLSRETSGSHSLLSGKGQLSFVSFYTFLHCFCNYLYWNNFCNITAHFIPGVFLILVGYVECNFTLANTFLFFALGFNGAASIANLSNNQDLSPNFAGFLYGIMNTIGATSGYIVPTLVEYITGNQQVSVWNYFEFVWFFCNL